MDERPPAAEGASLSAAPVPEAMPPGFVPLRLVMLPDGVTLELDRPDMTLGRHSGADLRLPMPDISRRHCRFSWSGGTWTVSDLASLNGVYVNGLAVRSSELAQNDLVRVSCFVFSVDLSYPAPPKVPSQAGGRLRSVIRALAGDPGPAQRRLAS